MELVANDYALIQSSSSAACYLVTQSACRFLVDKSQAYSETLDDFITDPSFNLNVFQLFPTHAVQIQFANETLNQVIPLGFRISELTSNPKLNKRNKEPSTYRLNKKLKCIKYRFYWLATD